MWTCGQMQGSYASASSGFFSNRDERLFSLFSCCLHEKKAPLFRLILKRSALKFFGIGMCVRLYAVNGYDLPSFDY